VILYALTSFVGGYVSSVIFSGYALVGPVMSNQWIKCMFMTAAMFPGTVLGLGFFLNFVAVAYDSAQAIPFGGMVVMFLIWLMVDCPLVVIGTVVGRHSRVAQLQRQEIPHVNQIPRLIPAAAWYRSKWCFILFGGILPFGSIFIELYLVFTSFWSYKLYYVYGFLLLVFFILLAVTACVSVVCCYFLLSAEDHQWQWTSFGLGASVSLYVFLYAVYFYIFKTKMAGFFMFTFYFTYMAMFCFGIGIMCGAVAFFASSTFVRRIYRGVKVD
jgi:transmembrane 9 superfamily protein 3